MPRKHKYLTIALYIDMKCVTLNPLLINNINNDLIYF